MTANAGRKPAPRKLQLLNGRAPGRDSGGREVKPTPGFRRMPPDKPAGLSPDASRMWDLFVAELSRLQLTKPIDGPALEVGCETYARWKQAKRARLKLRGRGLLHMNSQGQAAHPLVGIEERASKDFRAWCSEFGLTPAAEGKLGGQEADGGEEDNPFA